MKKLTIVAVVLILILGGGGWLLWTSSDYVRTAALLPKELAAARSEGIPVTPEDLRRIPPVPPQRNAAEVVRQFSSLASSVSPYTKLLNESILSTFDWNAHRVEVLDAVRECAPYFDAIDEAIARPDCDFERPWDLGPNVLFPELASIKMATKSIAAKAWAESMTGHAEQSWRTLEKGAKLARFGGADPVLIGYLVRIACEAITIRTAENMMVAQHGSPTSVEGMRRVLRALGTIPDLGYALRGEAVMQIGAADFLRRTKDFRILVGDGSEPPATKQETILGIPNPFQKSRQDEYLPAGLRSPWGRTDTAFDSYKVRAIQAHRELVRSLPRTPEDMLRFADSADQIVLKASQDGRPSGALLQVVAPVYGPSGEAGALNVVRRRMCALAASLYEIRNRTGRFPAALPGSAEGRIDLYSGRPFVYVPADKSFLLYSVGKNRQDDHGVPRSAKGRVGDNFDELFGVH